MGEFGFQLTESHPVTHYSHSTQRKGDKLGDSRTDSPSHMNDSPSRCHAPTKYTYFLDSSPCHSQIWASLTRITRKVSNFTCRYSPIWILGFKMPQKGRSRVNKQHGSIKLTDLSSWSSILPRSRGQSTYYEPSSIHNLGNGSKRTLMEL